MTLNQALISETTLSTVSTSVTLSVPAGYTDLRIVMSVRCTSSNTNYDPIGIKINGNTGTGGYRSLTGSGSAAQSYGANNETFTASTAGGTWLRVSNSGIQPGGSTANIFSNAEFYILDYLNSGEKAFHFDIANEQNAQASYMDITSGVITNSGQITSISFACRDGSFAAGSSFTVYGISKLGVTPTVYPLATGGDIIKNDGTYWYHAFLSTGSFKPQVNLTADILQVAGGGGGGSWTGGGGGAGGLLGFTSQALASSSSYVCTVGSGGAGGTYSGGPSGSRGGNSQFGSLTASVGGGGGGGYNGAYTFPTTGGSGGGGTTDQPGTGTQTGAAGTSGQGYDGGSYDRTTTYAAGGGGGAGADGYNNSGVSAGSGGVGVSTYSSWGSATGTGQNVSSTYYYAGGGGGGQNGSGTQSSGGYGGGGAGRVSYGQTPDNGIAATGGGGGGGPTGSGSSAAAGGNGGSGIIIIRYPMI